MAENKDEKLKQLEAQRDKFVNKIFTLMLEILVIFGAPAVGAYFLGAYLDRVFETEGKTLQLTSLAAAFILSWAITIIKYRKIDKQLKEIDKKIKEVKEEK